MAIGNHFCDPSARVILLMGAPGSGKGTQSSTLASRLRIPLLATGEILRAEAKRRTPEAERLRCLMASGKLVDDETICAVVAARFRRDTPAAGVILDGFPRTAGQAAFLDDLLREVGLPRPTVIHLNVSAEGLLLRLTARRQCARCGAVYNLLSRPSLAGNRCERDGGVLETREDDREEVILRRLQEFEAASKPLFAYYKGADFHRLNADGDPEAVASDLLEIAVSSHLTAAV